MLCDDCKQREAVFHSKIIKNGVSKEKHLCSQCQQNYAIPAMDSVSDLFSNFTQFMLGGAAPRSENIICPECGSTSEQFLESGYVGCAGCYKAFDRVMMPFIRKIQSDERHIGKIPAAEKAKPQTEAEMLQRQLEKAIKTENFEEASIIRDKIRKIQG